MSVRELRDILKRLYIGPHASAKLMETMGPIDNDLLPTFEVSFLTRQVLRFHYVDRDSNATEREAEPQAMLVLPPIWYLVGYDRAKAAFRHFRMDRIKRPEVILKSGFILRTVPLQEGVCPLLKISMPA